MLTQAAQQTHHLSEVLYKNGGASYLQVLTSETNYFSAELNLVEAQVSERLALVQLSNWDTNATGLRNIMPFRDWLAQPHQVDCSGGQGHLGPRSFDPVPRSEPRPQDTEEVLGKSCGCVVRD